MNKRFDIDKQPILRGKDRIPYEKINAKFITLHWDASIEYDSEYGWFILASKSFPKSGVDLRRIKPFKIINYEDLLKSLKFQQKVKTSLVEVIPFKRYKGDRIFFPEITDEFDFMSEAKFILFRKFFRTYDSSLEEVDNSEADKG